MFFTAKNYLALYQQKLFSPVFSVVLAVNCRTVLACASRRPSLPLHLTAVPARGAAVHACHYALIGQCRLSTYYTLWSNYHMTAVVQVQLVTCLDNQLMLRVVSDHLRSICINKKNSSFAEAWDLYWLQSSCRPENSRYDSWPGSSSLTKVKDGQLGNGVFRTSTHRRLPRALPSNRTRQ